MKIICCYTTEPALKLILPLSLPAKVEMYDVSDSIESYHNTFAKVWQEQQRFINIEHDMKVSEDRLKEVWDCPKPWCTIPYFHLKEQEQTPQLTTTYGLGVAKFHEALMRFFPTLIIDTELDALTDIHKHYPPRHWIVLADRISNRLRSFGYVQHVHWPVCEHEHHSPEYYQSLNHSSKHVLHYDLIS